MGMRTCCNGRRQGCILMKFPSTGNQLMYDQIYHCAVENYHLTKRESIVIDGLQPNQGWWFLSCDSCNRRAVEEGAGYRCTSEKCGGRNTSPRFRVPVVASGDGCTVEMVFVELRGSLVPAGETSEAAGHSAWSSAVQEAAAGSGSTGGQIVLATSSTDEGLHTPPPLVVLETLAEKSTGEGAAADDPDDVDLEEPLKNPNEKEVV